MLCTLVRRNQNTGICDHILLTADEAADMIRQSCDLLRLGIGMTVVFDNGQSAYDNLDSIKLGPTTRRGAYVE